MNFLLYCNFASDETYFLKWVLVFLQLICYECNVCKYANNLWSLFNILQSPETNLESYPKWTQADVKHLIFSELRAAVGKRHLAEKLEGSVCPTP